MAEKKYSVGSQMVVLDENESFGDFSCTRVLFTEKLTTNTPVKPEIVEGLTNIEDVFNRYRPTVAFDFVDDDGIIHKETHSFKSVSDFNLNAMIRDSTFLLDISSEKQEYQKINKQLKTNKPLKLIMSNQQTKAAFVNLLKTLVNELK